MHRIVQLTDCHLFAQRDRSIRGICTWPRTLAVLQDIRRRVPDFDLLVITGDTAHDEEQATYELVRDELAGWADRLQIIPGNHDNRPALREVFPESNMALAERVVFHHAWDDWQVIGLDSQRPGELAGSLGHEQLAWLRSLLETTANLDTVLMMHHPPIEVHSDWLDKIKLQDAAPLASLLNDFPQIRLVCCGHVHQQVIASFGGTTVVTTPAVGHQFLPRTELIEIDPAPPAYRVLELSSGGQWSTQVLRCQPV